MRENQKKVCYFLEIQKTFFFFFEVVKFLNLFFLVKFGNKGNKNWFLHGCYRKP